MQKQTIGPIKVESLANGGAGIVRSAGQVIFVHKVVPGDEIICRITRQKKRYAEAELLEVVQPSPARRLPPCPVAADCGGCQLQQLTYSEQLSWKERLFRDTLTRQCAVAADMIKPIAAAPNEWNYRSRVQIKCTLTKKGFVCGFYRPKSHYVVPIESCPIIAVPLNGVLTQLRSHLDGSRYANEVPQIDLAIGDGKKVRAVVHFLGSDRSGLMKTLQPLEGYPNLDLFVQFGPKYKPQPVFGDGLLTIAVDHPALDLQYCAGGFAQINLEQNRRLVDAVVAAADLSGRERVLDLYCGMGNFSLPLARRAATVTGVEDFALSIEMARVNARGNSIKNVDFHVRSAAGALTDLSLQQTYDLLLLDPPRAGAYSVMEELLVKPVKRVIYVSCDAQTLARDLKPLLAGNYRLLSSQPFDLFPQTHHVESLSILKFCG